MTDTEWSKRIRKRDGIKCRICNATENLTAHHLYSKSEYPQLKHHLNNGITLCESCHRQYHQDSQEVITDQFIAWCFRKKREGTLSDKGFKKIVNICSFSPSPEVSLEAKSLSPGIQYMDSYGRALFFQLMILCLYTANKREKY